MATVQTADARGAGRSGPPGMVRPAGTSRAARRRATTGLAFIAPAIAVVGVFFLYPLLFSGWMSLHDWPLLGGEQFIGLDNYRAIPSNELFTNAIRYTLLYTLLATIAIFVVGAMLAWLANARQPGVAFYRTAYFLPVVMGLGVSSLLWYAMYSSVVGPIDPILQKIGVTDAPLDWLGSTWAATFSIIAMTTWKFAGFQMIVLLVGLQAIPRELYEAARMDGASDRAVFRYVTLPLLRPTIALLLILSVTGSLLSFDQFFIMTGGGPQRSTVTLVLAMYREAFVSYQLGAATALAVVLLAALVLINLLQLLTLRRKV